MQRPSAAAKYVLQRRTRSHLRGSLQTRTQEWAYKHGTSLSPPHTSSASQNVSQSIPRSVSRLAFKSRQQAKTARGFDYTSNQQARTTRNQPGISKAHTSIQNAPSSRSLGPSPALSFLGSWWTSQSHSSTDGFPRFLCVFIIRTITKGGRPQLQPTASAHATALGIYYSCTCNRPGPGVSPIAMPLLSFPLFSLRVYV